MPDFRHIDPDSPEGRRIAAELECEWSSRACSTAREYEIEMLRSTLLPQERRWSEVRRRLQERGLVQERCEIALWGAVQAGVAETYMLDHKRIVRLMIADRPPRRRRRRASQAEICAAVERLNSDGQWRTIREYQADTGYTRQQLERVLRKMRERSTIVRRKRNTRAHEYAQYDSCDECDGPRCEESS